MRHVENSSPRESFPQTAPVASPSPININFTFPFSILVPKSLTSSRMSVFSSPREASRDFFANLSRNVWDRATRVSSAFQSHLYRSSVTCTSYCAPTYERRHANLDRALISDAGMSASVRNSLSLPSPPLSLSIYFSISFSHFRETLMIRVI